MPRRRTYLSRWLSSPENIQDVRHLTSSAGNHARRRARFKHISLPKSPAQVYPRGYRDPAVHWYSTLSELPDLSDHVERQTNLDTNTGGRQSVGSYLQGLFRRSGDAGSRRGLPTSSSCWSRLNDCEEEPEHPLLDHIRQLRSPTGRQGLGQYDGRMESYRPDEVVPSESMHHSMYDYGLPSFRTLSGF